VSTKLFFWLEYAQIKEMVFDFQIKDLDVWAESLPSWMQQDIAGVSFWQMIGLLIIFLAGFLIQLAMMAFIARQAQRWMRRLSIEWEPTHVKDVSQPLGLLAGAVFFSFFLPLLNFKIQVHDVLMFAARMVAGVSSVWCLYHAVELLALWMTQNAAKKSALLDDQLVPLIRRALKILVIALGTVFVLQNLKVDVASLLAGLGIGGLALALAAKETISNLFGSATIFADKPFQIGDWIVVGDKEGIVETVGFRSTRIRTFYHSLVTIPNAKVADSVIDNYGVRPFRRVITTLGLAYDTPPKKLEAFVDGVKKIILADPCTRKDAYDVHFHEFGVSALQIMVTFHLRVRESAEELRKRHEIFLAILELANTLPVELAFPTQTLHIKEKDSAKQP
jgi:MscS family membrane protein